MLKKSSILALALFMSATPALAQSGSAPEQPEASNEAQTEMQSQSEATTQDATAMDKADQADEAAKNMTENAMDKADEVTDQASDATQNAADNVEDAAKEAAEGTQDAMKPEQGTETAESPERELPNQIVMQDENTILAEELIGATVYSTNDEEIGDINDLIVNLNGSVDGVVVGVGGFLGIGEKDVAVEMNAISVTKMEDESVRLVLSSTKEELENAPSFKTVAEQKVEREIEETRAKQLESSQSGYAVNPAAKPEAGTDMEKQPEPEQNQ